MAYIDPQTIHNPAAGTVAPAAWGDQVRDDIVDLNARATAAGAVVATSQTRANAAYGDLATAGPAVTVITGTTALVSIYCACLNDTIDQTALMSFAISGATTVAATDAFAWGIGTAAKASASMFGGAMFLVTGLTAGSNTFTAKYRSSASGTASFSGRRIAVWPANKLA